jgi:hypothetical protein
MLLALAAFGHSTARAQNSAGGSKSSGTDAAKRSEPGVSGPTVKEGLSEAQPPYRVETPTERQSLSAHSRGRAADPKSDELQKLINSCAAAVEDLAKTRILVDALERENGLLKERLETEKRTSGVLLELNETRKAEAVSLRETVAAKNETIVAKDGVIAAQDKLIETLKKKKTSPLKRIQDVLIGVALFALFR